MPTGWTRSRHDLLEAVARAIPAAAGGRAAGLPPAGTRAPASRAGRGAAPLHGAAPGRAGGGRTRRRWWRRGWPSAAGAVPPAEWIAGPGGAGGGQPVLPGRAGGLRARDRGWTWPTRRRGRRIAWPASLQSLLLARIDQLTEHAAPGAEGGERGRGALSGRPISGGCIPDLGPAARVRGDLADAGGGGAGAAGGGGPGAGAPLQARRDARGDLWHAAGSGAGRRCTGSSRPGWRRSAAAGGRAGGPAGLPLRAQRQRGRRRGSTCGGRATRRRRRGRSRRRWSYYSALLERLDARGPGAGGGAGGAGRCAGGAGRLGGGGGRLHGGAGRWRAPAGRCGRRRRAGWAWCGSRQGHYAEAPTWLETARAEYAALGDGAGEARALAERGRVY